MTVASQPPVPSLPWVAPRRRRAAWWLYRWIWVRDRRGPPRPLPTGTTTHRVPTASGTIDVHVRRGTPGTGAVVLVHPDRRYGGHWFVKTGWTDALHALGRTTLWFDQPGYGTGTGGSPYLAENVLAAAAFARDLGDGPVDVVGLSLGAFAVAIAAPHMPWVRKVVLESPYRSFDAWYRAQPASAGRSVARLLVRLVPHNDRLDTVPALAQAPQDLLVAASEADAVTPLRQTQEAIGPRPATWIVVRDRGHLDLWNDPTYRHAVLAFLHGPGLVAGHAPRGALRA